MIFRRGDKKGEKVRVVRQTVEVRANNFHPALRGRTMGQCPLRPRIARHAFGAGETRFVAFSIPARRDLQLFEGRSLR